MDGIPTAQGGVASEHHTRRLVDRSQLSVDVGEMLQATALDKLTTADIIIMLVQDRRSLINLLIHY